MAHTHDLFEKTFDQQVQIAGSSIDDKSIYPNRIIPGEIVFEPLETGVRVTARDGEHRVLWGYIGSKETVRQIHCLVATYDTLQDLLAVELDKRKIIEKKVQKDPMDAARAALESLEKTVKGLRDGLAVKKTTEATLERARTIARIVSDANRQISIEMNALRG